MADVARADRGLVQELQRSHQITVLTLALMLVLSLMSSGFLLLRAQPRVEDYLELGQQSRLLHEGMIDQETGLRGWLATQDERFLEPYRSGRAAAASATLRIGALLNDSPPPGLTEGFLAVQLARADWNGWADEAVATPVPASELGEFLREGKARFDDYRAADGAFTDNIVRGRADAVSAERTAMIATLACYLALLLGAGYVAVRRRRELQESLARPLARMLGTIASLHDGDLKARARTSGVTEIDAVGRALGELAGELERAKAEAESRERRLAKLANRFALVVRVAREVSGSLSVREVSLSVTEAAADLLDAPTNLWVRGADQQFTITAHSNEELGEPPGTTIVPTAVVAAAANARPVAVDGHRAYPLVLAGMVIGVLEASAYRVDADTEQVLEALLSTAGVAMESAHLHSTARAMADNDALTGLANRRRFEADLDEEWQRCSRYDRPLSLVLMDLDHFKTLNDTHGHLFGDEVLRATSVALRSVLRGSDTAYRYGGEEFAVILRETGLDDAESVADRIRQAVSESALPETGVLVTASAGVAQRSETMVARSDMVSLADQALYEAKRAGRDRVVAAELTR